MPETHRKLGRTGLTVFPLGFGGAPAAYLKTEEATVARFLNELLDSGMNLLDTAASYAGSEQFIGDHLSARRKDYVLVSKCGNDAVEGVTAEKWSPELVTANIDRSLKRLKTDYVDVMLLHTCDLETLKKGDALGALVRAQQAGKVRHVGYSGDNEAVAEACAMPEIAVVEMSVNYCDQRNVDVALPAAKRHDVGVIAKRPVANAAWRGPDAGRGGFYDKYASEYVKRHEAMRLDPTSIGFTDADWPEIALRFAISFPEVSVAVAGTTKPENARRNVEWAKKGPLPPKAVEAIRQAFHDAPESGTWTGQT